MAYTSRISGSRAAEVIELSSDEEDEGKGSSPLEANLQENNAFTDGNLFGGFPIDRNLNTTNDHKDRNLPACEENKNFVLQLPEKKVPRLHNDVAMVEDVSTEVTNLYNDRPLCRQFWNSGDYQCTTSSISSISKGLRNRMRIDPTFLHSNATSHKWAFGAIAELLDNALDEVHNGATFVSVDKMDSPVGGNPALLILDNGGGMDPDSLRRCMSFGFSDKQSESVIGQYGNGFKTSTMRLGADVIVFTRCQKNTILTQSVGLLSYTFLKKTCCDDIIVPTVDYQYDLVTGSYRREFRRDEKLFSSNLSLLLNWSLFRTESELLKQFDDIGERGTKIVVFNLWFNDDGNLEIDFYSDMKDILISGAEKTSKTKTRRENNIKQTKNYVATQLRYSLRVYSSILYLHLPKDFKIILRGEEVVPHHIAKDLMYRECVLYKPQVAGVMENAVITTIGFVKGAPNVDVQGFSVYHKNRLILPFWRVANSTCGRGRGVVGILEANFIKPTHDKQDFEKSTLFHRLEHRLKDMTSEYWDLHCHLVGYENPKLQKHLPPDDASVHPRIKNRKTCSLPLQLPSKLSEQRVRHSSGIPVASYECSNSDRSSLQNKGSMKSRHDDLFLPNDVQEGPTTLIINSDPNVLKTEIERKKIGEIKALIIQNKKLCDECSAYEEVVEALSLKEKRLRSQLEEVQKEYKRLLVEYEVMKFKSEKA